jgi:carboxymethylenebutenolidase
MSPARRPAARTRRHHPTILLVAAAFLALPAPDIARAGDEPDPMLLQSENPPAPARGEMITFKAAGETIEAYLCHPGTPGPHAGVVVIHESWGLNGQIRRVADRLASVGYLAIVPDLFRGKLAGYKELDLAHELMRGLDENRAVAIVQGAAAHLRTLDGAANRPVGTVGFSMGGRISLATALKKSDIQAAVMFYGGVETTQEAVVPLKCPLLGLFGQDDRGVPEGDVKKFEAALKAAGKTASITIYPGAGRGFFNDERPSYVGEAAQDAWVNLKDFLDTNLKPGR